MPRDQFLAVIFSIKRLNDCRQRKKIIKKHTECGKKGIFLSPGNRGVAISSYTFPLSGTKTGKQLLASRYKS